MRRCALSTRLVPRALQLLRMPTCTGLLRRQHRQARHRDGLHGCRHRQGAHRGAKDRRRRRHRVRARLLGAMARRTRTAVLPRV